MDIPDDLPRVERHCVRVVVLDAQDRVLLFHTQDPTYPELGTWWELPGGGIEAGETEAETAVRELHEETGFVVDAANVGPGTWRRLASFRYRGERRVQHEVVVPVRLEAWAPAIDGAGRVGFEDEDYFGFRWWTVAAIVRSDERFYPGRLPALLVGFLTGEEIDEPLEVWS